MNYTKDTYERLEKIFDAFNDGLFSGELRKVLVTFRATSKKHAGYYAESRFANGETEKADEIALSLSYFRVAGKTQLMQTIVHEMCHLWQHQFGKPGRKGYHNKEWADKMKSVGLMPSTTGDELGKTTGQKMSDFPIRGGAFETLAKELIERHANALFFDAWGEPDKAKPAKKNKVKYTCACGYNVWGKPDLSLTCDECERHYLPEETDDAEDE